jgi:hypothetical protein
VWQLRETVRNWFFSLSPADFLQIGLVILAALTGVALLMRSRSWLRARRTARRHPEPDLTIDLSLHSARGPSRDMLPLELYNIPVRLAIVVLAPLGRGNKPAQEPPVSILLDHLLPGLSQVKQSHGTEVLRWPEELSASGFASRFFATVKLPGDRGKGTPWSSLAGRFEVGDVTYMGGLALCAESPNSLGEFTVERPNGWLDMLRIRPSR